MNGLKVGRIHAFCGPMFSGKTTRLTGLIEEEEIAKQFDEQRTFLVINSANDTRYGKNCISTHSGKKIPSYFLENSEEIYELYQRSKPLNAAYIDEAMFFDSGLVGAVRRMAHEGTDVYLSFLNLTSEGEPFPFTDRKDHVGALLAIANSIERSQAICSKTGRKHATMTHYKHGEKKDSHLVGAAESYQALNLDSWHELNTHNIPDRLKNL